MLVKAHCATRWMVGIAMVLLLALTYWLYRQGFSAGFQFDDAPSIGGISRVSDLSTAMAYLFDGRAGSVGRPLALATFLLQKESWPHGPAAFFMVNVLIHLVNGILVYWFGYRLAQYFPEKLRQPAWFSMAVTALWLTLPLHVPASLMAVQRMTTLSSMFMLLGLVGYVTGRGMLDKSPVRAYWLMSVSVALGTVLAVLCKENGALLPLYVLVLEVALLRAATPASLWFKRWLWVFLGAPVFLVAAYFVYRWPTLMSGYALRTFDLHERLLTESRILWEYLGQICLPARHGIGPYHDNYPISRGWFDPVTTVAAILAWAAAILSAWWLRKRYPVVLFALLWYFTGHLIESTFIPLELYFEHRNYLAALGPLLAITVLIWGVPAKIRRVSLAGLLLMVLLRLFVLGEVTHVWGQPLLSAKLWAEDHPQSVRAALFLAKNYSDAGDRDAARQVVVDAYARVGNDTALALHSAYSSCLYDSRPEFRARLMQIEPVLATGALEKNVPNLLKKMLEVQQQGECPYLTLDQIVGLTDQLLKNPRFQAFSGGVVDLHLIKSRVYALEGKTDLSIQEIIAAFDRQPEYQIAITAGRAMIKAGRHDDAIAFLDQALSFAPRNPVLRQRWKTEFDNLKLSIAQARAAALSGK